jgi:hypothetical protein
VTARVRLLVRERIEVLGRAGGLSSGPILTGLSRTIKHATASLQLDIKVIDQITGLILTNVI